MNVLRKLTELLNQWKKPNCRLSIIEGVGTDIPRDRKPTQRGSGVDPQAVVIHNRILSEWNFVAVPCLQDAKKRLKTILTVTGEVEPILAFGFTASVEIRTIKLRI